jgi:hypothetical protein
MSRKRGPETTVAFDLHIFYVGENIEQKTNINGKMVSVKHLTPEPNVNLSQIIEKSLGERCVLVLDMNDENVHAKYVEQIKQSKVDSKKNYNLSIYNIVNDPADQKAILHISDIFHITNFTRSKEYIHIKDHRNNLNSLDVMSEDSSEDSSSIFKLRHVSELYSNDDKDKAGSIVKYYFDKKRQCTYGKLRQFDRDTCWFNATLNMILLDDTIRSEIMHYWKTHVQQNKKLYEKICPIHDIQNGYCMQYDACPRVLHQDYKQARDNPWQIWKPKHEIQYIESIRTYILRLFANIYIYKYLPKPTKNKNVMLNAAVHARLPPSKIKLEHELFNKHHQYIADGKKPNLNVLKDIGASDDIVTNTVVTYLKAALQDNFHNHKVPYPEGAYAPELDIQSIVESNDYTREDKRFHGFDVRHMTFHQTKPISEFHLNGKKYVLTACILVLIAHRDHAVCGFRCNGEYYVYDSQNKTIKTDWHLGKFEGVEGMIMLKYLVYARSDSNTGAVNSRSSNIGNSNDNSVTNDNTTYGGKSKSASKKKLHFKDTNRTYTVRKNKDNEKYIIVQKEKIKLSAIKGRYTYK